MQLDYYISFDFLCQIFPREKNLWLSIQNFFVILSLNFSKPMCAMYKYRQESNVWEWWSKVSRLLSTSTNILQIKTTNNSSQSGRYIWNLLRYALDNYFQWAKSPKNSLKECDFVNSALKIQLSCSDRSPYIGIWNVFRNKLHIYPL